MYCRIDCCLTSSLPEFLCIDKLEPEAALTFLWRPLFQCKKVHVIANTGYGPLIAVGVHFHRLLEARVWVNFYFQLLVGAPVDDFGHWGGFVAKLTQRHSNH